MSFARRLRVPSSVETRRDGPKSRTDINHKLHRTHVLAKRNANKRGKGHCLRQGSSRGRKECSQHSPSDPPLRPPPRQVSPAAHGRPHLILGTVSAPTPPAYPRRDRQTPRHKLLKTGCGCRTPCNTFNAMLFARKNTCVLQGPPAPT